MEGDEAGGGGKKWRWHGWRNQVRPFRWGDTWSELGEGTNHESRVWKSAPSMLNLTLQRGPPVYIRGSTSRLSAPYPANPMRRHRHVITSVRYRSSTEDLETSGWIHLPYMASSAQEVRHTHWIFILLFFSPYHLPSVFQGKHGCWFGKNPTSLIWKKTFLLVKVAINEFSIYIIRW